MGYNPHANVCECFDFECMCKNDRNVILTTFGKKKLLPTHTLMVTHF